jgi:hypothetical protein
MLKTGPVPRRLAAQEQGLDPERSGSRPCSCVERVSERAHQHAAWTRSYGGEDAHGHRVARSASQTSRG